ncbi:EAL domain-containing protein [Metallibacterium sp.]|uniref:putative bifunctional diguanylate cyclase/phosphodiesterase n=1 Tax=Metallibacterium sp. TaxID=2940281 RepID=UPI002609AC10|nr:EAL domain-containing protein [Metallibacterium sp.]
MLLIVLLVLVLTWIALQVQVAVAGLLNGESIWSKAEKQAVIDLYAYAETGSANHLAAFRRQVQIVADYRVARDALASAEPNYRAIEQVLVRTGALRESIPGGLFVLRHFARTPYIHNALESWRATDAGMDELQRLAVESQAAYATGAPSAVQRAAITRRILAINQHIAPLTDVFSHSIALGAAWLARVLFWAVTMAAALMIGIWLYFARRAMRELQGSESRYRTLLEGAQDAIAVVDAGSGRILEINQAAEHMIGGSRQQICGRPFVSLFPDGPPKLDGADAPNTHADVALAGGGERVRHVAISLSRNQWGERTVQLAIMRDMTERLRMEEDRRVAAEALANIAEGVLIADAEHRIISGNAAAEALTGYSTSELIGTPLDALRSQLNGAPLDTAPWQEVAYIGHWQGRVQSRRKDGRSYPERLSLSAIRASDGTPHRYVAVFDDISESEAYQRQLEHLAMHDPLTALLNRAAFEREAARSLGEMRIRGRMAAMLFIDLDGFKAVNDSYGHAFGDQLLQQVGQRVQSQIAANDRAGRIGGDEFTLLLCDLGTRDEALPVVRKLLLLLSEPFHVLEHEIFLSASIGISSFPDDGDDPATLIANADAAMYSVKADERNSYRVYTKVMQASTRTRLTLAGELRQAIARGEFHLVYQPSLDLRTRKLVAVEALLRWQHPERGEISPAEFIPLAESLGMVRAVGAWVINEACRQIRAWLDAGLPSLRVAVNISASHLRHPQFVEHLRATLRQHRCPSDALMIELTESAILHIGERSRRTLAALHELGVSVAVDDFGTGYSSLAYLKLPAIHTIKIDQSFVNGLPDDANDAAITRAILALAHSLGLEAIAEGIETEQQLAFLLAAGCLEGQGYLFARPLLPDAIAARLAESRTPPTSGAAPNAAMPG